MCGLVENPTWKWIRNLGLENPDFPFEFTYFMFLSWYHRFEFYVLAPSSRGLAHIINLCFFNIHFDNDKDIAIEILAIL